MNASPIVSSRSDRPRRGGPGCRCAAQPVPGRAVSDGRATVTRDNPRDSELNSDCRAATAFKKFAAVAARPRRARRGMISSDGFQSTQP
eukprot:763959-Hanusia_phi.AAC.9